MKSFENAHPTAALMKARLQSLATMAVTQIALLLMPSIANAQSGSTLQLPIVTEVACPVIQWMQGPLGIIIFICVVAATLLIGMIAKMDWSRIITVTVILAILVGLGGIISNSSTLSSMLGASSCLRTV